MPTIECNKHQILQGIERNLSDDELADTLAFLGTVPEEMHEDTIKLEVFPNRPDLLSEQGIIRALRSYLGVETGLKPYQVRESDYVVNVSTDVAQVRPHTSCCVVKNLHLTDESLKQIIQIQEKLHITFGRNRNRAAIGIYPMENIAWPIAYTAKSPSEISFTPLDAHEPMSAERILTEHEKGKEFAKLLEGKQVYPLFIDAEQNVLSMPPVINAERTGRVTESTTDVFIECSGHEQHTCDVCIAMLAALCADIGGELHAVTVTYPTKSHMTPFLGGTNMLILSENVRKLSGLSLDEDAIVLALQKMGHNAQSHKTEGTITVTYPSYREDIMHPVDLIEDVCIGYGFNNIEPQQNFVPTEGKLQPIGKLQSAFAELLVGLGFIESATYAMSSIKTQDELMLADGTVAEHIVTVQHAATEEYNAINTWLTPNIMKVFAHNRRHSYPQKTFTLERVVIKRADGVLKEEERLAIGIAKEKASYTDIKQVLDYLSSRLQLPELTVVDSNHPSFIKGRAGRILCENKSIGFIGEIHPQAIVNFGIEYPIVVCELILDNVMPHTL